MSKEEFIEKIGVANNVIDGLNKMLNKVKQDKIDAVQVYIDLNKKFEFGERVRCLKTDTSNTYKKEDMKMSDEEFKNYQKSLSIFEDIWNYEDTIFLGYGYVNSILADEDYGTIFYEILMEDVLTKENTDIHFAESQFGAHLSDSKYCKLLLEKI